MGKRHSGVKGLVFGLFGLGLVLAGCSEGAHACSETRTCPVPVGFIDAGNFDNWWSAGASGEITLPSDTPDAGVGGAGAIVMNDAGAAGQSSQSFGEPASVLAVTPADGSSGVASDAEIVITFSQTVDAASFEAAYESADLPAAAIELTWNDEHTAVSLKPKSPLSYEAGLAEPDGRATFAAKTYHYGFRSFASDAHGNSVPAQQFSFSTLRSVSLELPADGARTGNWTDGEGEGLHNCLRTARAPYAPCVCVGDDANNVRYEGFVSFDLSELPPEIRQWSSARIVASAMVYGATAALGEAQLEHVAFTDLGAAALTTMATADLGPFYAGTGLASGTHFELDQDVTGAVAADYAARAAASSLTQYRLRFADVVPNAAWDDVELTTSEIRLATTYALP